MKIGIDIDTIRNINDRVISIYNTEYNAEINIDNKIENKDIDIEKEIKFPTTKEKQAFYMEDHAYEIYGCSQPFNRNLGRDFNIWLGLINELNVKKLSEIKKNIWERIKLVFNKKTIAKDDINVGLIGIMASDPIIGSTYFFLSKIACHCRNIFMPIHSEDTFQNYDVVITSNPRLIKNKTSDTILIIIKRKYNKKYWKKADFTYDNLEDIFKEKDTFFEKLFKKIGD